MSSFAVGDVCVIAGACCPRAREIAVDLECTVVEFLPPGYQVPCQYCDDVADDPVVVDVNLNGGLLAPVPRKWLRKRPGIGLVLEDEETRGLEV